MPYTQAEALMAALDSRRYPYERLIVFQEVHGFYSLDHRTKFYARLLAFLDRQIGSNLPMSKPAS